MIPAIEAQLAAARQKQPATARKDSKRTSVSPAPPIAPPIGRNTPPEPVGPKPSTPIRYQVATSNLFEEQHPGLFRLVVVGPLDRLPEVTALLDQLRITDLPA